MANEIGGFNARIHAWGGARNARFDIGKVAEKMEKRKTRTGTGMEGKGEGKMGEESMGLGLGKSSTR